MTSIAIVGAGFAGLVAAKELSARHEVTLFEKSRGVGGRMATRYADGYEFDHGAQFFVARTPAFKSFLKPLIERGVVASWFARFAELEGDSVVVERQWNDDNPHYVAMPRMNAIGKALAEGLNLRLQTCVAKLERRDQGWLLLDDGGKELGMFDWVVFTAPAEQTRDLLPADSSIGALCEMARMRACFALMLGFEHPLELPWQAALVRDADISWISVNSSKPGRAGPFSLVVHSTNAWADARIEDDIDAVRSHMLSECSRVSGIDVARASYCGVHRWRYANADSSTGPACGVDVQMRLAACGDWFVQGRVEAAFTSAIALSKELAIEL